MELIIEGLDKLASKSFDGRKIYKIEVRDTKYHNGNAYVFTFTALNNNTLLQAVWEDEFEVWLYKTPNTDGKYEMFVMGLHSVTCYEVPKVELLTLNRFTPALGIVVSKCKLYFK